MSPGHEPFSIEAVIRAHHAAVLRFLRSRGASREDARDLAQEAYVRLLRYEGTADIESPAAMVFRVASNIAADHLRASAQRHAIRYIAVDDELPSDEPSVERELTAEQKVMAVERALASLSPRCRGIFFLSRVEELTYEQIAVRVGISVKAVEKHVSRALRVCNESS